VITPTDATQGLSAAVLNRETPGDQSANELSAINEDGTLASVDLTDQPDASVFTSAIFDTKLYVMLAVRGVSSSEGPCGLVAARKSDGAMFCVQTPQLNLQSNYWSAVQSDASGNLVWLNLPPQTLIKLDMTDPNQPTQSSPLDTSTFAGGTLHDAVNAAGDAIVSYFAQSNGFVRVMKANGGFYNASSTRSTCLTAGAASEPDNFYFTEDQNTLVKLTKSGSDFTKTTLGSMQASCAVGLHRTNSYLFFSQAEANGGSLSNVFFDVTADTITPHTAIEFAKITGLTGDDSSVVLLGVDSSGNGGIVRFTPGVGFTTLLAPGDYAINILGVGKSGDVTFHGQRSSDGATILGTIPAGTTDVTVISSGLPVVEQLVRIQ
jgi:hypothetical protein